MFHFQKWLMQCWNAWLINSPKCLYTNFLWKKCNQELNKCHCHCLSSCSELSSLKISGPWILRRLLLKSFGREGGEKSSQSSNCFWFLFLCQYVKSSDVCLLYSFLLYFLFVCLFFHYFFFIIIIIWVSFLKTSTLGSVCSGTGFMLQSRLLSVTVDGS